MCYPNPKGTCILSARCMFDFGLCERVTAIVFLTATYQCDLHALYNLRISALQERRYVIFSLSTLQKQGAPDRDLILVVTFCLDRRMTILRLTFNLQLHRRITHKTNFLIAKNLRMLRLELFQQTLAARTRH
jgi:hypothetical protein